jgi:hypothetical protein
MATIEDNGEATAQADAREFARVALLRFANPDLVQIRKSCERARRFVEEETGGGTVDVEALVEYFRATTNIFVAPMQLLSDRDHVNWLAGRRAEIRWQFWERYRTFLSTIENLPEPAIRALDLRTEGMLDLFEDPLRQGPWDRRGLAVGSVQSGKTGNFLGLACKAVDAGYKLVIILAGIHNSLRAQTQMRMEDGLLGYNTDISLFFERTNPRVGVGTLAYPDLAINSMTSRREDGDFRAKILGATVHLGETPFIVVVKKHSSILKNLCDWLKKRNGVKRPDGKTVVPEIPLLLIDDEADHASINVTKGAALTGDGVSASEVDPSTINKRIRELLEAFAKSAYIGFTATPFANIFVDPDGSHSDFGSDLFPSSFIVSLPAPDNYISVEKVFGRDGDPDTGMEEREALPLTRLVEDFDEVFPAKAKADFIPADLPYSLKEAIRAFVLVCAARHARGQATKHNSMLVHVARFVKAQRTIAELVNTELLFLQRRISNEGESAALPLREELRELWESDFMPTTDKVNASDCPEMAWDTIESSLHSAIMKITVREINGTSADILDYEKHEGTGISVIAVGGNKLSRGLTLEGLSVSYYMRASKMYDSLLQMGRWFGYRPGYLDLCRIYTSEDLIEWYRHIALAEAELRQEFERMAALGATPREYGLKVRTHPDGMLVTALNKSRFSKKMQVSYEGTLAQCVRLDPKFRKDNDAAVAKLMSGLGEGRLLKDGSLTRVWSDVVADDICQFLDAFKAPLGANGFDSQRISDFIRRQSSSGDLVSWTVALISANGGVPAEVAGHPIGLVKRSNSAPDGKEGGKLSYVLPNSNVISPPDQAIDFEGKLLDGEWVSHLLAKRAFGQKRPEELDLIASGVGKPAIQVAQQISEARYELDKAAQRIRPNQKPPSQPIGAVLRDMRMTTCGLLLLYPLDAAHANLGVDQCTPIVTCAISFPTSERAEPVEYQVNEVYRKLNLEQLEEPEGDA